MILHVMTVAKVVDELNYLFGIRQTLYNQRLVIFEFKLIVYMFRLMDIYDI